ncbi:MAG TPA: HD domain-containing protein [Polyangiaceae bacterium]|nr:HD domain-containing protein [Polyangiaceae bacterium]
MTATFDHAAPAPAGATPGPAAGPAPRPGAGPSPGPGGGPGPGGLLDLPAFRDDFDRLASVTLDPARHTSPDARAHSLAVARRARALARAAGLGPAEARRLDDLALVHDIGKLSGTGAPSASVERLGRYGLTDPSFVELVRFHDINLPWYQSRARAEAPSDRAWAKLARRVDLRLLALFMVADRVDCPGGFRANAPLLWFLGEARARGLVGDDVPPPCDDDEEREAYHGE